MSSTRQLAAIMFTDIVGYTAMMGKDSQKALELVRQSREIQKPLVEKFNGKWLKEMGDGAMAQFNTALDAVNCAIEIQRASRADFEADLRIGIHLGDITIEENDIYGDGVNIAARLESIADPGGIYISDAIEKAIRGQLTLQAKYLGEISLKNVDYGVRSYALQGIGLPVPVVKEEKQLKGHIWAEVKRRGIIRAGITYLLMGLSIILLMNLAQSYIELPLWLYSLYTTIFGIGFPIAMYLAWNYERSPEGFVKTTSQKSWQNPLPVAGRKPLTSNLTIAVLLVITLLLYFQSQYINPVEKEQLNSPETNGDKSIAVLPFANMSNDPNQEYFSDGMMEEILNHLVKIEGLQVTSRTSVMQYKGTNKTIGEIARELGVTTILEGSVRKSGNKVRITVQLINAKTDKHLWSETFDKELNDIFAIQSEVAQLVATSLQANVSPEVRMRIESQPTINMDAYNLWLEGNYLYNSGVNGGFSLWEQAIELDSTFAPAYASIGNSWLNQGGFAGSEFKEEFLEKALSAFDKAMKFDPEYPRPHESLGNLYLWYHWDFDAAEKEYERYSELNPASIIGSLIDFLYASGRFEEGIEASEKLIKEDVNNPNAWARPGLGYYLSGQIEKGNAQCDLAMKLFPQTPERWLLYIAMGREFIYAGRYAQTIEILSKLLDFHRDFKFPRVLASMAMAHYHLGELDQSELLLEEIKAKSKVSPAGSPSFYTAMIYSQMGDIDTAFEWLEKAYIDHEVEMYWLKVEPPFEPLHDDPRWKEMLVKIGFPE